MNLKYILIVFVSLGVILGCESDLEVNPISNIGSDAFYKTPEDMEQAVVAAYDALQDFGQYGFNYFIFGEIRADDSAPVNQQDAGGVYGDVDLFQLSPNNILLEDTWNSCYKGIQRCNIVLNRIDNIGMDEATVSIRKGEVKYIRALTYFNLVRLFGDLPLVLSETTDPFGLFSVGRTPVSEVYNQIIQDLEEAASELPSSTNQVGRVTSGAANALLGKVYLTLGEWQNAINALNRISGYVLNDNFSDNFGIANENSPESIFEIQFQAGNGEGSRYPNELAGGNADLVNGIGTTIRNQSVPSPALFASFENGDIRRDVSIGSFNGINLSLKLIDVPIADYDSDLNIIVLRYADVLLMKAEALNELAYSAGGEAFDLINQIRNRAGISSFTSLDLPDQVSFREAVYKERRHEFVSEFHRWFDLLRTGRATEVMNASTIEFTVQPHQLLLPLPLTAVDAINNPEIFPQNPGY